MRSCTVAVQRGVARASRSALISDPPRPHIVKEHHPRLGRQPPAPRISIARRSHPKPPRSHRPGHPAAAAHVHVVPSSKWKCSSALDSTVALSDSSLQVPSPRSSAGARSAISPVPAPRAHSTAFNVHPERRRDLRLRDLLGLNSTSASRRSNGNAATAARTARRPFVALPSPRCLHRQPAPTARSKPRARPSAAAATNAGGCAPDSPRSRNPWPHRRTVAKFSRCCHTRTIVSCASSSASPALNTIRADEPFHRQFPPAHQLGESLLVSLPNAGHQRRIRHRRLRRVVARRVAQGFTRRFGAPVWL